MSQHDINREQWVKFYYTQNKQLPELFGRYNTGALIVVERQKGDKVEQQKENNKFYELYRDDKLLSSGYGFQSLDIVNTLTGIAVNYKDDTTKIRDSVKKIKDTLDFEYIKKNSNLEDAYIVVNTNGNETKLSVSKLLDVENPFFEDLVITSMAYNIRYGYGDINKGIDKNVQVPITLVNNKPVPDNVLLDIPIGTFIKEITCSFSYNLNDTLGIDKGNCTFNLYTKDGTHRLKEILPNIDELNSDGVKTENVSVTLLLNANASESIMPSIDEQTILSDLKFKIKYGIPSVKKVLYKKTEGGQPIYVKDNFYNRPDTYIVLPKITIKPKLYFISVGIEENSNEVPLNKLSLNNVVELKSLTEHTVKCDYIVNKKNVLLLPKGMTVSRAYLVDKKTGYKESISSCVKYVQQGDDVKTVQVPWMPYTVVDQCGVTEMNLYVVTGLSNITENDDMSILLDINYEPIDYFQSGQRVDVSRNLTIVNGTDVLKTVIDESHENLYWHGVTDLSTINLYK